MVNDADKGFRQLEQNGLTFSQQLRDDLRAVIASEVSDRSYRRGHERTSIGKGDSRRAQDAVSEAKRILDAAKVLESLMVGPRTSGINWIGEIHGQIAIRSGPSNPVVGHDLAREVWVAEFKRLFNIIGHAARERRRYFANYSSSDLVDPATLDGRLGYRLGLIFIRANGKFGGKHGRAGFPKFLQIVWHMLPGEYREFRKLAVSTFADKIGRAARAHTGLMRLSDLEDSIARIRAEGLFRTEVPRE